MKNKSPNGYIHQQAQQGFTLLEILVVIFIIAIMVSMVGLRFFQSSDELLQREARQLQSKLNLALDLAVLQSRNYALGIGQERYTFFVQNDEAQWLELSNHAVLRSGSLDKTPYRLELMLDDLVVDLPKIESDGFIPQVYFLASGEMTPLTLRLLLKEKSAVLPISLNVDPLGNSRLLQGDEVL